LILLELHTDGENELRFAMKFCFEAGLSATETLIVVQKAHGNEAVNRSNVFGGFLDFETEGSCKKMTREVAVQIDEN
jgi:hypothetical protein